MNSYIVLSSGGDGGCKAHEAAPTGRAPGGLNIDFDVNINGTSTSDILPLNLNMASVLI